MQEHSTLCRQFISQIESQKDQHTELLQKLLNQVSQIEANFNLELPKIIKQQVFDFIDHISFFNQDISQGVLNKSSERDVQANTDHESNSKYLKMNAELIMKLASNKSNFCSDQFLNELNQILQKLDPLLQQFNTNQVHMENKEAINFEKLSEQKLNLIEDYVKHSILLATEQSYQNEVKDSLEIKQMNSIINSKMNFLSNEFKLQFECFLIDVKPFIKQTNFSKIYSDKNAFEFFRNLEGESITDMIEASTFKQNFGLIATKLNNGQINCFINKKENGEYEIQKQNDTNWVNCISSMNLQKDLKYIFRIQVENINEANNFMIGLTKYSKSDQNYGCSEYLSSHFVFLNNFIVKSGQSNTSNYGNYGIDKKLKGENFEISKENMIEMRVCLKDQILEVVDYPNYQYKLALENQCQEKLTKNDDLRFYLGLRHNRNKIILKEAQILFSASSVNLSSALFYPFSKQKINLEADTNIISKWPPVNNCNIIQDLIKFTSSQSQCDYIKQITDFFNQFKEEIAAKVDIIQKKMINQALEYPIDNQSIIKKYQEISKVHQLKQLLSNQETSNMQEYSTLCRQFISQIESQKNQNTELLQKLLNQVSQIEANFNLELPKMIKQQVFDFIDHISFFKSNISQGALNKSSERDVQANIDHESNSKYLKMNAELIMKLASNKSNFCSDQFLNELNQILQKLDPLLQQFNTNQVHMENKEAINFEKISEQKLNLIEDYVKHSILLATEQSYQNEVKDSLEIKQMNSIINSKMNFLSNEFTQQFECFLIDVKPFLKQINFSKIYSDKNAFEYFRNLAGESIRDMIEASTFKQNFGLIATKLNNGQINCLINKKENGEYEIQKQNVDSWVNCISSMNLQKDLKYIFRIQVENINERNSFMIGLTKYSNSDQKYGYEEYLSSHFAFLKNFIVKSGQNDSYSNFGIDKKLKGENFEISKENMIEMRVCLKDQILEVVDYPNYQYKVALENKYQEKLTKNDDLRFYLGLRDKGNKIILKEAQIVKEFRN
ncbi:hypothetical protein ABPG73_008561 [Tetrahymena malaccensis]